MLWQQMTHRCKRVLADRASKTTAMLTCETSELTGVDLWTPNRMTLQTAAATGLFHFLARIEYEIEIFTLTQQCT